VIRLLTVCFLLLCVREGFSQESVKKAIPSGIEAYLPYNPVIVHVRGSDAEADAFTEHYPRGILVAYDDVIKPDAVACWHQEMGDFSAHLLRIGKGNRIKRDLQSFAPFLKTVSVLSFKLEGAHKQQASVLRSVKLCLKTKGFHFMSYSELDGEVVFIREEIYKAVYE
jgi:hypothetical protein